MRAVSRLAVVLGLVAFGATALQAQPTPTPAAGANKHLRQGFWIHFGMGYGSLGCEDCDRAGGATGQLAMGGTISQKLQVGGASNVWVKSEDGVSLTVGAVTATVRYYPIETGGFFLTGGLGYGTVEAELPTLGTHTETGFGALAGLGYDIRVGRNVSLTPYLNGFLISAGESRANVGHFGLALTIH